MDRAAFFEQLWTDYCRMAPRVVQIRERLTELGEHVQNDHVAFRTYNRSPISLSDLEPHILAFGYRPLADYDFADKHLRARAYLCEGAPRIFLSELLCERLSAGAIATIDRLVAQIPTDFARTPAVFWAGRPWQPLSFAEYERLSAESEYAGWLAALGLRVNHFTVSVNQLQQLPTLQAVLDFVEAAGYALNQAGGRIKGTRGALLEQGSTLADTLSVEFADGLHVVPTCYYEFALRYRDANGELYQGFVPSSANRIFESTDRR